MKNGEEKNEQFIWEVWDVLPKSPFIMSLYLILDTIRPINQILLDANISLKSLLNVSRFQEIVMGLVLLFCSSYDDPPWKYDTAKDYKWKDSYSIKTMIK